MISFYSILKISPNIATQDSVAIGVILFDGERFRYYISDHKIRAVKKLIDVQNVDFKFIINQLTDRLDDINIENKKKKLFNDFDKISNPDYFNYLNNYSNGLLQFSKPKQLLDRISDSEFEKLVKFLFNEPTHKSLPEIDERFKLSKQIIEEKLISKINKKVHTDYTFQPTSFPSIYFSYEMDCVGLNGSLIGAKSLSFNKSLPLIDKDISHYFTLISSLSSKFNKSLKENKFYLISEEPENTGSKEHQLWESVRYNDLISVIHPEESNQVADLIFEKNANKFLLEIE